MAIVLWVGFGAAVIFLYVFVATIIYHMYLNGYPDGDDDVAELLSIFWPIAIPVFLISMSAIWLARRLLGKPQKRH